MIMIFPYLKNLPIIKITQTTMNPQHNQMSFQWKVKIKMIVKINFHPNKKTSKNLFDEFYSMLEDSFDDANTNKKK